MIFSPIFFPACNTAQSFVRAARVAMIIIKDSSEIFQPLYIAYSTDSELGKHVFRLADCFIRLEAADYDEIYDSGMDIDFDAEADQTYAELSLPEVAPYYIISFEE